MKKILHVVRSFNNGGTEKYIMNLLKNTYKEYDNYILIYENITYGREELEQMGIKIIQLKDINKEGVVDKIKFIRSFVKINQIDVVYSYTYYNSAYVMLAAFLGKVKKRITHAHRSASEQRRTLKYNIYIFLSKILISLFSTDCLACGLDAGKSLFYKKFKVINNGIELEKYKFNNEKRNLIRKEFNISDDDIVIGTIGRLDKNKNQIFMIKVFEKYHKENTNSKLLIIGEGEQKNDLKELIRNLKIEDVVILLGNREDANELYNAFDLFMLTSIKEGLPFVLIEAQANGLNSIVSDSVDKNADISNSIKFVSLDDDISKWLETIKKEKFIRKDNIKKIIEKGYSLESSIKSVMEIYG